MKHKNNLDEMQELKLMKIEHYGFWTALWGLVAVIVIQSFFNGQNIQNVAGELCILFIISIYSVIACVKNGIWSRNLKANFKTNLLISLAAGGVVGIFRFIKSYYTYNNLVDSLIIGIGIFVFTTVLCIIALTVTANAYKKRKNKLEHDTFDE